MYLTRAYLEPSSKTVRADLQDPGGMHRTIMKAFMDGVGAEPRKSLGVLYRAEKDRHGRIYVLLQSAVPPDLARWPDDYLLRGAEADFSMDVPLKNPVTRELAAEHAKIRAGARFAFRLLGNATRRILTKSLPDGTKRNGKRVPVRGDEERLQWLARRAVAAGFRVTEVRIQEMPAVRAAAKTDPRTFVGALFEGHLVVTDADAFRRALAAGVGPGKAFGFGLLSIQRAAV